VRPLLLDYEALLGSMSRERSHHVKPTRRISSVAVGSFVLTFECEHFYQGRRYHWMICAARRPDKLVSWGHAATRELAEAAAEDEVQKLVAGLTGDGPLRNVSKQFGVTASALFRHKQHSPIAERGRKVAAQLEKLPPRKVR
jgi:hypothetical protein